MWMLVFLVLPLVGFIVYLRSQIALKRVAIIVLGDIGRSPRMQYHALSFSKEGFDVDIVGYGGSTPHKDIICNKKINIYHVKEPPKSLQMLPKLIVYVVKTIWQIFTLLLILILLRKPRYFVIQNPPAVPSMLVGWIVAHMRNTKLFIDWHNYGYTILSLALSDSHPLVKFASWYEHTFGRFSHANICVSDAMKEDLKTNWNIEAVTMYDRPPSLFKKTDLNVQHRLFCKLSKDYDVFRNEEDKMRGATAFTLPLPDGTTMHCENRPALVMSSTSWTEDEDFSILLVALEKYEEHKIAEETDLPDIICVITGKGPLKSHYYSVIRSKTWHHVKFCMPWLEAEDYPVLLGSADVGVCLHTSSSGLDLPMKVVDMFGCGIPVCAVDYKSLNELVKHGDNGLVFKSASDLAVQLQDLLRGFPDDCKTLRTFGENLRSFRAEGWDQSWKKTILPLLESI